MFINGSFLCKKRQLFKHFIIIEVLLNIKITHEIKKKCS